MNLLWMLFWSYFTCIYGNSTCPTCNDSMAVIPAQSDPSELFQLVALWVPLHHVRNRQRCSSRFAPGDGDIRVVFRYSHILKGLG